MGNEKSSNTGLRAPIVTVLGHVDHGKTTLLDAFRETSVQLKEAGGITQGIGASVLTTKDGSRITFVDTPGHAAFANMRSRGARIADIAILVVAADDGVKPQTKEALSYILEAKIPYIVAATKMDLPSASSLIVKSQLEKESVLFEGGGGDVPLVEISAKTKKGLNELLEMITLIAELNGIKGDKSANLEAVIIETVKDKRGPLASAVVRNGALKIADNIVTETVAAKVRGLFDYLGKSVREVGPGEPVQIMGFSVLPEVGSKVWKKGEKEILPQKLYQRKKIVEVSSGEIPVTIKADNAGALEAIIANIPEGIQVVEFGVGEVNETDVFMAKSSGASHILAFETKAAGSVAKLAETEGVAVESFEIIYKLFERLEELVAQSKDEILGQAKILTSFPFNNNKVAGCKVLAGVIGRNDKLVLTREEEKVGEIKAVSLKREKQNIDRAKAGEEFGILFTPQLDFRVGDVISSVRRK
ncbi:hypothetical protein A2115_02285 [Candidatus Woesebacteria bacterium GWA1_41_8]|uniref:Tr-type G domain-containing protein n=1 Tax=Candidatus Woesebacteria bacterium GWA1_41_8 TaxID=1802471 RepID=A0A1F7WJT5_9BACT|nr:MAG: hypothetical protein A2115_02285 [Candidatus Woesebacteria bacterium GWA1_41_8]